MTGSCPALLTKECVKRTVDASEVSRARRRHAAGLPPGAQWRWRRGRALQSVPSPSGHSDASSRPCRPSRSRINQASADAAGEEIPEDFRRPERTGRSARGRGAVVATAGAVALSGEASGRGRPRGDLPSWRNARATGPVTVRALCSDSATDRKAQWRQPNHWPPPTSPGSGVRAVSPHRSAARLSVTPFGVSRRLHDRS